MLFTVYSLVTASADAAAGHAILAAGMFQGMHASLLVHGSAAAWTVLAWVQSGMQASVAQSAQLVHQLDSLIQCAYLQRCLLLLANSLELPAAN